MTTMDVPVTLSGWAQLVATMTGVLVVWTGFALSIAKRYVKQTAGDVVRESVDAAMQPVRLELITMNGEIGRIRVLESKVDNGLIERQKRIEIQIDRIIEHLVWNGDERRQP